MLDESPSDIGAIVSDQSELAVLELDDCRPDGIAEASGGTFIDAAEFERGSRVARA